MVMLLSWSRTFAKPGLRLIFSPHSQMCVRSTQYTTPCLRETQPGEWQLAGNQGGRQCPSTVRSREPIVYARLSLFKKSKRDLQTETEMSFKLFIYYRNKHFFLRRQKSIYQCLQMKIHHSNCMATVKKKTYPGCTRVRRPCRSTCRPAQEPERWRARKIQDRLVIFRERDQICSLQTPWGVRSP